MQTELNVGTYTVQLASVPRTMTRGIWKQSHRWMRMAVRRARERVTQDTVDAFNYNLMMYGSAVLRTTREKTVVIDNPRIFMPGSPQKIEIDRMCNPETWV